MNYNSWSPDFHYKALDLGNHETTMEIFDRTIIRRKTVDHQVDDNAIVACLSDIWHCLIFKNSMLFILIF